MFDLQAQGDYKKAVDDSVIVSDKFGRFNLDQAGSCSESCEVDFSESILEETE